MDRTPPTTERHVLELPGRGRTVVWDSRGPAGSPTLFLVHGVTLTAALNWGGIVESLGRQYRVVLLDQRGHGDALSRGTFRLEDCADDIAAVAEQLGDQAAHGVPDRHDALDAQPAGDRGQVVGAVLQPEDAAGQPVSVATLVDEDDAVPAAEASDDRAPVQGGSQGDAVHEEQRRRPGRPRGVPDDRSPASGQLENVPLCRRGRAVHIDLQAAAPPTTGLA